MVEKKNCFVIAPIGESGSDIRKRSDKVLKHLISPALKKCGYEPIRADKSPKPGIITNQVIQHIADDPLVIADLTGLNPNVFYELALRHAANKPIIQIINIGEKLPFDVATIRTISFDINDLDSVEETRKEIIKQIKTIEVTTEFTSPVSVALNMKLLKDSKNPEQRSIADLFTLITDIGSTQQSQLDKLKTIENYQQNIVNFQQNQLNKLETIGYQTKETIEKLRTTLIQEMVNKFFFIPNIEKNRSKKYKCFFPVHYKSQPLPVIAQGDYYAIHVFSTLLSDRFLELKGISSADDENFLIDNAIFVCAPRSNQALKNIFKSEEIKDDDDIKKRLYKWPLEELELPCWFVEDYRNKDIDYPITKIKIFDKSMVHDLLESPAQIVYNEASELKSGMKYEFDMNLQRDYGIFARLKKNDQQYIIIAGLHQYGTWIIANFLSNLLSNNDVHYKSKFLGKEDFIAVMTGEFDNEKLTVKNGSISVFNNYIWIKENDIWVRKYDEGVANPSTYST